MYLYNNVKRYQTLVSSGLTQEKEREGCVTQ